MRVILTLLAGLPVVATAAPVTRVWTAPADFAGGHGYAYSSTTWETNPADGYLTVGRQQEYAPDPTSGYPAAPLANWWSADPNEGTNWRILRYDSTGAQIWSVAYNGPASADDSAQGLGLLPGGGFVAVGREIRSDINQSVNMRIRIYGDSGALVSEQDYNDANNSQDEAWAVAVDPVGAGWAVGGFEMRTDLGQSFNGIFRLHNSAGTLVTMDAYDSAENLADEYRAVAYNAKSGGWVAAGYETRALGGMDWLLTRYSAAGARLWSTAYASPGGADEQALAVATSPVNGNIVVAGYENLAALGQGRDWAIRTYTAAGAFVSKIGCDAPVPSQDDGAVAAALDISKNSWVAGWENRDDAGEGDNMMLRLYDSAGVLSASLARTGPVPDGDDRATAVALTPQGGAVFGGYEDALAGAGVDNRWRIVFIRPFLGTTLDPGWSTAFDGPMAGGDDRLAALACASSNSVYAAGWMEFGAPWGQDWVVKYINPTGSTVLWTRTLDGVPSQGIGGGNGEDRALGASIARPSTSVYIVGYATDTVGGTGRNWVLRKFGMGGTVMLEVTYDGPASGNDLAYGVGADAKGNIFVAGEAETSPGNTDWVVQIFDPFGVPAGPPITYDSGSNQYDSARAISVMPNGAFFVAGVSNRGDLGEGENWLVHGYDPAGTLVWTRTFNAPPNLSDQALGISASNFSGGGRVLIAGTADRSDLGAGIDWRIEWTNTFGGTLQTTQYASASCLRDETATAVAVDATGDIIAGGWEDRGDIGEGKNWTLRKYTAAGALLWRVSYNGPVNLNDEITSLGLDAAGNVYAAGVSYTSGGKEDFMVRKYTSAGLFLWERTWGSGGFPPQVDMAHAIAVSPAGEVTVAGSEFPPGQTQLTRLPYALQDHAAVRVGNRIYVIGGVEKVSSPCVSGGLNQCVSFVRFAEIGPSGNVGPWTRAHYPFGLTGPAQYPFGPPVTPGPGISIAQHRAVAVGNRIYVVGGTTNCAGATPPVADVLDSVFSAAVDPVTGQTGPWEVELPLLQAGREMGVVYAGGALFALGGQRDASGAPSQSVQKAEIGPTGRLYSSNQQRWEGSILRLPVGSPACPGNNLCNACSPSICVPCTNACVISANECLGWEHFTAFSMMRTIAFVGAAYQNTMTGTPCTIFNGTVYGWLGDDNKPVSWVTGVGTVPLVDAQAYSTPVLGNGTLQLVGGYGGSGALQQVLYPPLGLARGIFRTGGTDGAELRPATPKTNELFAGLVNPMQFPIAVKGVPGVTFGDYAYLVGGEHAGSACYNIYRTKLASTTWWVDAGYWLSPPYDLGTTVQLMRVSWSMSKSGAGLTDDWASVRYRVAGTDGVWSVWSPRIPEEGAMPSAPGYYTYASDVPGNQPFFRMPLAPGIVQHIQFEVSLYNDNGGASDGGTTPTLPRFDEFRLTYNPVPPPVALKPGCPLELFPNPAKDRLAVRFEVAPEGGEVTLRIVNTAAQIVGEQKYSYVAGGIVTEYIDLTGWAPGAYVVLADGVARGGDAVLYCTETHARFRKLREKFVIRR